MTTSAARATIVAVTGWENEYTFISVDQLIEDFIAEVEQWKCEH